MYSCLFTSTFILGCVANSIPAVQDARDPLLDIAPIPGLSFRRLVATTPTPAVDQSTHHYQRVRGIRHKHSGARSAAVILGARQRRSSPGGGAYQNVTTSNAYGMQFALTAIIGDIPVEIVVDTGSADTWVVQDNFTCVDFTGMEVDPLSCGFGPTYPGGFQYGPVPDVHMFSHYGDGEVAVGPMGYSDVTLGNLTVDQQQIALVNESFWFGDNATSGILGLAYPSATSAFYGGEYDHEVYDATEYQPVFTSMWQKGLVEPYFSLALTRNSTGGVIGWGGIPATLSGLDYSSRAVADLIIVRILNNVFPLRVLYRIHRNKR